VQLSPGVPLTLHGLACGTFSQFSFVSADQVVRTLDIAVAIRNGRALVVIMVSSEVANFITNSPARNKPSNPNLCWSKPIRDLGQALLQTVWHGPHFYHELPRRPM